MRTFRIWLLLLLAVLLPIRGAVAAAMLCPPAGSGTQAESRLEAAPGHSHHVADAAMNGHHGHEAVSQHDDSSGTDHHFGGQADKCNVCSAFCSVTSLLGGFATDFSIGELPEASFPQLSAPAPSFISDGQERPPRTI